MTQEAYPSSAARAGREASGWAVGLILIWAVAAHGGAPAAVATTSDSR